MHIKVLLPFRNREMMRNDFPLSYQHSAMMERVQKRIAQVQRTSNTHIYHDVERLKACYLRHRAASRTSSNLQPNKCDLAWSLGCTRLSRSTLNAAEMSL